MPPFPAPLTKHFSPSLCAKRPIAAGLIMNGSLFLYPRISVLGSTWATLRSTRGRKRTRRQMEVLRWCVSEESAAEA